MVDNYFTRILGSCCEPQGEIQFSAKKPKFHAFPALWLKTYCKYGELSFSKRWYFCLSWGFSSQAKKCTCKRTGLSRDEPYKDKNFLLFFTISWTGMSRVAHNYHDQDCTPYCFLSSLKQLSYSCLAHVSRSLASCLELFALTTRGLCWVLFHLSSE